MVDEAHGGHLYFGKKSMGTDKLPQGAILQGADICAQSMHKVTGSLTQSSLLHVGNDRIDRGRLEANLHMVQSTSPSYLLMTSLDAARYELAMHGPQMLSRALELAENARSRINRIKGMHCYGKEIINENIYDLDTTRLVISASDLGITGFELADRLYEEYRVGLELADEKNVVAVVTYANEREDIQNLVDALEKIAQNTIQSQENIKNFSMPSVPESVLSPRQAYFAPKKRISWENAKGKITGEALIPYPPGIPLVNPGEIITDEIWEYMEYYRREKLHFHGPSDKKLDTIQIIE